MNLLYFYFGAVVISLVMMVAMLIVELRRVSQQMKPLATELLLRKLRDGDPFLPSIHFEKT